MEHIADLLETYKPNKKKSERGEILKKLSKGSGLSIPRIAYMVQGLELDDLYFLESDCRQAAARGVAYGAALNRALKVK